MPELQDYLRLASEADDLAALLPDAELAANYHKLADSYHRLARFHEWLSTLLGISGNDRGSPTPPPCDKF